MRNRRTIILLCLAVGVALEIVVVLASGRREAWDSGLYWTVGLPAALVCSVAIGRVSYGRDWLATVLIVPAQVATMILRSQEIGALIAITIVLSAMLSAPFVIAAWVGSLLRPTAAK